MLTSVSFKNFKSYAEARLPLSGLTVLIGANASGKSNAIEALRLLTWLAEGRRLDYLFQAMRDREVDLRGSPLELPHGRGPIGLGCMLGDDVGDELVLELSLKVAEDGFRIIEEQISSNRENLPLYKVVEPALPFTNQIQVSYNNFARGPNKPQIVAVDQQAIFTQLTTPARFDAKDQRSQVDIPFAAKEVQTALDSVLFLDPVPRQMREYVSRIDHKKLRGDGANLSAVLRNLCNGEGKKEDVLGFVRSLPEQDITDISFLDAPDGYVMVQLHESFSGAKNPVSARLLSDGTLRALAIAAGLLSVGERALVAIEEIDNGVHPSRARALLENIRAIADKRRLRVLITTHNPALLDAIPANSLPDVVVCYRDPGDGLSRLRRLGDMDEYPEIVARGPLGRVVAANLLDRIIKNPVTHDQRVQQAEDFVASLEAKP
jgi:predicted ATPase